MSSKPLGSKLKSWVHCIFTQLQQKLEGNPSINHFLYLSHFIQQNTLVPKRKYADKSKFIRNKDFLSLLTLNHQLILWSEDYVSQEEKGSVSLPVFKIFLYQLKLSVITIYFVFHFDPSISYVTGPKVYLRLKLLTNLPWCRLLLHSINIKQF